MDGDAVMTHPARPGQINHGDTINSVDKQPTKGPNEECNSGEKNNHMCLTKQQSFYPNRLRIAEIMAPLTLDNYT